MKGFVTIFLLCITSISGHSQLPYPSIGGKFSVKEIKACAPYNVDFYANDCDGTIGCAILYRDFDANGKPNGDNITNNMITHTYLKAGHYRVLVIFGTTNQNDSIDIDIVDNIEPDFELYYCGGTQVNLNIKDSHYDQYLVDFHDGNPTLIKPKGSPAFTYNFAPGPPSKMIDVRGQNINAYNNCFINTDTLSFRTISKPIIPLLQVQDAGTIKLDFSTQQHVLYKLEIATNTNATFQQLQDVYNVNTAVVNNVKADNSFYCFRLGINDPCISTTVFPGNVICSSNFHVTASNNQNNLTWQTSTAGINNYTINKTPGSPVPKAASPLSYVDTDIICNTVYSYQLVNNYGNGIKAISHIDSVKAISTDIPPAIDNISSLVTQTGATGVDLLWLPGLQPKEYSIFKSLSYNLLGKSTTEKFTDASYSSAINSCYKIGYTSFCGNASPLSSETCPIQLVGSLQKDNSVVLTWTAYNGYKNGVSSYVVEKYSSTGQLLQTFSPTTSTTLTDNSQDVSTQAYSYVVKANANDGGITASISNSVVITKEPNLYYPTAFTPNEDGLNDKFVVFGQFVNHFELKIFNRWGEMLFASEDMNQGWDGNYQGNAMPEGSYAFIAKLTDLTGNTFTRSGSVMLLRKK